MTKEDSERIQELDDRIDTLESYIRDLKNERNRIILFDVCNSIITNEQFVNILKGGANE